VKRVTELAREYDMAFFKFDGFCASCESEGHGHLPGPYAKEANIDAYIELLEATRNARPGVYLDPTCGIWLSPWWLEHADSFWGSVSGDYPSIIVPGPVVRDSATTTRDAVFRQRLREHPGFPASAMEHLGIIIITSEKWEDNAIAVAGRGSRLLTLYINPDHFPNEKRDWAFLACLLKWVRTHAGVLQQTEMIGGDPLARETYGFAHFFGSKGILSLRNPFIEPGTVKITLDDSIGPDLETAERPFLARIVYPRQEVLRSLYRYGDTLEAALGPYETLALHLEPIEQGQPALLGARYREVDREGGRVRYEIFATPGEKLNPRLIGGPRPDRILLDSRPVPFTHEEEGVGFRIETSGASPVCSIENAGLEPRKSDEAWLLAGRCVVRVPGGVRAAMHLLCDPRSGSWSKPRCEVTINKRPVEVRALLSPEQGTQTHKPHSWNWFDFDVPEGESVVSVTLALPGGGGFPDVEAGWWLWLERPLAMHTLEIQFPETLPPKPSVPLPMPIHMEKKSESIKIMAAKSFRWGGRWPALDRPIIYLDEVYPQEVSMGWGRLQRNRSVWKKPMVIAGREFSRGLGTHAVSRLVYRLEDQALKGFRCQVGRDEHAQDGRISFQVRVDGKTVFDSGPMDRASPPKTVEVNLEGAARIELVTLDGGDGIDGDHGNWTDACFLR
jgi:hypothetical protein